MATSNLIRNVESCRVHFSTFSVKNVSHYNTLFLVTGKVVAARTVSAVEVKPETRQPSTRTPTFRYQPDSPNAAQASYLTCPNSNDHLDCNINQYRSILSKIETNRLDCFLI